MFSGLRLSSSPHIGAPLATFEEKGWKILPPIPSFETWDAELILKYASKRRGRDTELISAFLSRGWVVLFFFFCLFFLPFFPAVARKQYSRVSGPISDWPARRWLRSIKRHDATLCASRDPFGGGVAYKLLPIDSTSAIVRRRCEQPAL